MKTKEQIEALRTELKAEIDDRRTTKERRNNLKGAVDAIDFILQDQHGKRGNQNTKRNS